MPETHKTTPMQICKLAEEISALKRAVSDVSATLNAIEKRIKYAYPEIYKTPKKVRAQSNVVPLRDSRQELAALLKVCQDSGMMEVRAALEAMPLSQLRLLGEAAYLRNEDANSRKKLVTALAKHVHETHMIQSFGRTRHGKA